MRNRKIMFLFLNQNICCGYSKEPSQLDEHSCKILLVTGKSATDLPGPVQETKQIYRPLDKSAYWKIISFISHPKHMSQ